MHAMPETLDAVTRLIGTTKDFETGARSYLDDLEGQAIFPLEFGELPKGDREALELSSDVLRPVFDELAATFLEPHRTTDLALAERGYRLLWAALKAASIIGRPSASAREADIRGEEKMARTSAAGRSREQKSSARRAALVDAVKTAVGNSKEQFSLGEKYARNICPDVCAELERRGCPKDGTWPSISTIKGVLRALSDE
jgi:hypothetical protein